MVFRRREAAAAVSLFRRRRSADPGRADTVDDVIDQRVTEIIARVVGQLSGDGEDAQSMGLYALERLAQTYPGRRHAIVNAICTYLQAQSKSATCARTT